MGLILVDVGREDFGGMGQRRKGALWLRRRRGRGMGRGVEVWGFLLFETPCWQTPQSCSMKIIEP